MNRFYHKPKLARAFSQICFNIEDIEATKGNGLFAQPQQIGRSKNKIADTRNPKQNRKMPVAHSRSGSMCGKSKSQ